MLEASNTLKTKKVLFDVGHPAHVHLFKNLAHQIIDNGGQVLFTVRPKELEKNLLEKEKFQYIEIGKHNKSGLKKIIGLISKNINLIKVVRNFKPDIIVSHGSFYAAQVSWLLGIPSITLEDTANREQTILYQAFTNVILSPQSLAKRFSKKQIFYSGLHELAYINRNGINHSNLDINPDKTILIRFISWNASHDNPHNRFTDRQKIELVQYLQKFGTVQISSEGDLPEVLKKYVLNDDPGEFHNTLWKSSLIISEGSTTAIEGCLSVVPTIYLGDKSLGIINFLAERQMLLVVNDLLNTKLLVQQLLDSEYTNILSANHEKLLNESIDLTKLLVWMIDQYPESIRTLKKQPDFQNNFLLK